jgi:hypothetical protein
MPAKSQSNIDVMKIFLLKLKEKDTANYRPKK